MTTPRLRDTGSVFQVHIPCMLPSGNGMPRNLTPETVRWFCKMKIDTYFSVRIYLALLNGTLTNT